MAIAAPAEENPAHATMAEFTDQRPRTEPVTGLQFNFCELSRGLRDRAGNLRRRTILAHQGEHTLDARLVGVQRLQRSPLGRNVGFVAYRVEQPLDAGMVGGCRVHRRCKRLVQPVPPPSNCSPIQARAKRSPQSMVGTDSPSTAAISARSRWVVSLWAR